MALFKKKYEKIDCPNEHIFRLDYDGVIKIWKCVVGEDEVVTYEGDKECKHLKIMNKERAPQVLQIDTVTAIYGEQIPFQLENGFPFLKLQGEWVSSDTFDVAKRNAALNGLEDKTDYAAGDLLTVVEGQYPIVVANIVADVILTLLKDLHRVLLPGGLFIASGIIDTRKEELLEGIKAAGLTILHVEEERGWVAITSKRD